VSANELNESRSSSRPHGNSRRPRAGTRWPRAASPPRRLAASPPRRLAASPPRSNTAGRSSTATCHGPAVRDGRGTRPAARRFRRTAPGRGTVRRGRGSGCRRRDPPGGSARTAHTDARRPAAPWAARPPTVPPDRPPRPAQDGW